MTFNKAVKTEVVKIPWDDDMESFCRMYNIDQMKGGSLYVWSADKRITRDSHHYLVLFDGRVRAVVHEDEVIDHPDGAREKISCPSDIYDFLFDGVLAPGMDVARSQGEDDYAEHLLRVIEFFERTIKKEE